MGLLCRVLGWSADEVQVHLTKARQDHWNPSIHTYDYIIEQTVLGVQNV